MHRSFDSNRLDATLHYYFSYVNCSNSISICTICASLNACVSVHMDRFDHFDHKRVGCTLYTVTDARLLLTLTYEYVQQFQWYDKIQTPFEVRFAQNMEKEMKAREKKALLKRYVHPIVKAKNVDFQFKSAAFQRLH